MNALNKGPIELEARAEARQSILEVVNPIRRILVK
jgi:hypothetical protein